MEINEKYLSSAKTSLGLASDEVCRVKSSLENAQEFLDQKNSGDLLEAMLYIQHALESLNTLNWAITVVDNLITEIV